MSERLIRPQPPGLKGLARRAWQECDSRRQAYACALHAGRGTEVAVPSNAKGWKVSLAEMLVLRDMMVWATSARSGSMNRGLDAPPRPWYVPVSPWAGPSRLGVLMVLF